MELGAYQMEVPWGAHHLRVWTCPTPCDSERMSCTWSVLAIRLIAMFPRTSSLAKSGDQLLRPRRPFRGDGQKKTDGTPMGRQDGLQDGAT